MQYSWGVKVDEEENAPPSMHVGLWTIRRTKIPNRMSYITKRGNNENRTVIGPLGILRVSHRSVLSDLVDGRGMSSFSSLFGDNTFLFVSLLFSSPSPFFYEREISSQKQMNNNSKPRLLNFKRVHVSFLSSVQIGFPRIDGNHQWGEGRQSRKQKKKHSSLTWFLF